MSWFPRVSQQPYPKSPGSLLQGWMFSGTTTGVAGFHLLHSGNLGPTAGHCATPNGLSATVFPV